MSNIVISRPRKFTSKSNSDNEYVKVSIDGKIYRVMLDDSIKQDWNDITDMEFGFESYDSRRATQEDVDAKKAEKLGDFIEESWSRLECVDYKTTLRDLALTSHKVAIAELYAKVSGTSKVTDAADVKEIAEL